MSQKPITYTGLLYIVPVSVFSLAQSLQLVLEINATLRLVNYQLANNCLICRLGAQCMILNNNVKSVPCDGVFVAIFFKTMYNKTIIIDSIFVIS